MVAAASRAARDPFTWAPLVGAGVFALDDFDERTSDWARDETPLFGSNSRADEVSDDLALGTRVAMWSTALATGSGEARDEWLAAKSSGLLVEFAATASVRAATGAIKRASDRERPDESDDLSFPSGHTSTAASHAALAARNLDSIPWLSEDERAIGTAGLRTAAFLTGWARVEAGRHYPADVLVGAALGNFLATFVHDAFLGLPLGLELEAHADRERALIGVRWSF